MVASRMQAPTKISATRLRGADGAGNVTSISAWGSAWGSVSGDGGEASGSEGIGLGACATNTNGFEGGGAGSDSHASRNEIGDEDGGPIESDKNSCGIRGALSVGMSAPMIGD